MGTFGYFAKSCRYLSTFLKEQIYNVHEVVKSVPNRLFTGFFDGIMGSDDKEEIDVKTSGPGLD